MKQVLEDPSIVKTGVHIKADSTVLHKSTNVQMRGISELSYLFNLLESSDKSTNHKLSYSKKTVTLATQVQKHLHLPLKKGNERVSDWSATLTEKQKDYAACDAYAGLQLYNAMERMRKSLEPCPPPPGLADLPSIRYLPTTKVK